MDESAFIEQTLETLKASRENAQRNQKTSEIGALLGLESVRERYGWYFRTVEQAERALQRRAATIEEEKALSAMMATLVYG